VLGLLGVRARDLTQLQPLTKLRRLHLNEMRSLVSIEGIEGLRLEDVALLYLSHLRSIEPLTHVATIRELEISNCRAIVDGELLGQLRSLEVLKIVKGPSFPSLEWLRGLSALRHFSGGDFSPTGAPVSLAPLSHLGQLRVLKLAGFKNVQDIEELGHIHSLEVLSLDRGPDVRSLDFLRTLTALRHLAVRRTKILDGDLHVLFELPQLQRLHALTPYRKHYSHTEEEVDTALADRRPTREQYPEE
jgi:hypothetical protein